MLQGARTFLWLLAGILTTCVLLSFLKVPGVVVDLPTFTEKDVDDIVNFGIKNNVDFIAASFVRKASDVKNLRQLLADNGGQHIKIICKIENQEGLENYDEILQVTDAIMVARGDLGMVSVVGDEVGGKPHYGNDANTLSTISLHDRKSLLPRSFWHKSG